MTDRVKVNQHAGISMSRHTDTTDRLFHLDYWNGQ